MKRVTALKHLPEGVVYSQLETSVGVLFLFASTEGLHAIFWDVVQHADEFDCLLTRFAHDPQHPVIQQTSEQLTQYFAGQRTMFDVPLVIHGTPFQQQAWQALQAIPFGETRSYGQQAAAIGNKNKARAVGMANNANPIPIIIPCHRVLGANGKLVGFGGGLDKKAFLLALKGKM